MATAFERPLASVFTLRGPDARRFANGMFTNNVRDLPVGRGQESAACDAKGRLLYLLDVHHVAEGDVRLVLGSGDAEAFDARYQRYIVSDDVVLERASGGSVISLVGADAAGALSRVGFPVALGDFARGEVAPRARWGEPGFDLLVRPGAAEAVLADLLAAGVARGNPGSYEARRVAAVDPACPEDAPERVLVHELGLRDRVLAFDKGCYQGQEVVHRLDVQGQVRRRLVGLRLIGPPSAPMLDLTRDGTVVGRLTSPCRHESLGWIALGLVRVPADAPGTALDAGGITATVAPSPS